MHPIKLFATLAAGLLIAATAHAQTLRIGASAGVHADALHAAVADARKAGLDAKVIEFTDWTTPNEALANGDLDLNYFQHQAFLDNAVKNRGYKFEVVGLGVLPNIGLFSHRIKSFAELKDGATVAVASDPINQGRGLQLLARAGLITLKPGAGVGATLVDIASNPKKLKFAEVEGPQLVRAIDDVDLAQGIPAHFVSAGKAQVAGSGLLYTGVADQYFALRFVARQNNANDPRVKKFVQVFQSSQAVREQTHKSFGSNAKLYTLSWVQP